MASNLSKADGLTPIVTFVSMIILGIVISEFIVQDPALQLPIILFFFFAGIFVAALELRAIIGRRRMEEKVVKKSRLTKEEAQDRLARYVADLFKEDIPFEDMDEEKKRKLDEMYSDEIEIEDKINVDEPDDSSQE